MKTWYEKVNVDRRPEHVKYSKYHPSTCLFHQIMFSQVSMAADPDASIALPFTPRPLNLNGELVGDVGFDPLNFSEEVRD